MKIQNILRTQAIVIGLGAAVLLFPNSASAQEIVNTEFDNGPYVTSFAQPAAAAFSTASTPAPVASNDVNPAVDASTPVVTTQAMLSLENSAERWLTASSLFGIVLLAVCAVSEVRRYIRDLNLRPGPPPTTRAALS